MTPEEILQVEKDIVATLKNIYDPKSRSISTTLG